MVALNERFSQIVRERMPKRKQRAVPEQAVVINREIDTSIDPWSIKRFGYNTQEQLADEARMSIGNGLLRIRPAVLGSKENFHIPATFVAGFYDQPPQPKEEGASTIPEALNIPEFTAIRLAIQNQDGSTAETLDFDTARITDYETTLNMQDSILTRQFTWNSESGAKLQVKEQQLLSDTHEHIAAISYAVTSVTEEPVILSLTTGINGDVHNFIESQTAVDANGIHGNGAAPYTRDFYASVDANAAPNEKNILQLHAKTKYQGHEVAIAQKVGIYRDGNEIVVPTWTHKRKKGIAQEFIVRVEQNKTITLEKAVSVHASTDKIVMKHVTGNPIQNSLREVKTIPSFQTLLDAHTTAWHDRWKLFDVAITGDAEAQQAVRYSLYQLLMSVKPGIEAAIGAKLGQIPGEGYNGHGFWDTLINMIPAFDADPRIAETALHYEYSLLNGARQKAKDNGYEGAWWQWESTIAPDKLLSRPQKILRRLRRKGFGTGEATPEKLINTVGKIVEVGSWKQEIHISFDVAYATLHYYMISGNKEFMRAKGVEMILEAAKFYGSRAKRNEQTGKYEYRNCEGPDEYHENVDNNAFTNLIAKWTLQQALSLLDNDSDLISPQLKRKLGLTTKKIEALRNVANNIYIPFNPDTLIFQQFDGFHEKTHIDLQSPEYHGITQMDAKISADEKEAREALIAAIVPEVPTANNKIQELLLIISDTSPKNKEKDEREKEYQKKIVELLIDADQRNTLDLSTAIILVAVDSLQLSRQREIKDLPQYENLVQRVTDKYPGKSTDVAILMLFVDSLSGELQKKITATPEYKKWNTLPKSITETDVSKQPDVMLALDLVNGSVTQLISPEHLAVIRDAMRQEGESDVDVDRRIYEEIYKRNFAFYDPLCSDGSSLAPATRALEAMKAGASLDDDNFHQKWMYGGNIDLGVGSHKTEIGLHSAAQGGFIQAERAAAGIVQTPDALLLDPKDSKRRDAYDQVISQNGALLHIVFDYNDMAKSRVTVLENRKGNNVNIMVQGREYILNAVGSTVLL